MGMQRVGDGVLGGRILGPMAVLGRSRSSGVGRGVFREGETERRNINKLGVGCGGYGT